MSCFLTSSEHDAANRGCKDQPEAEGEEEPGRPVAGEQQHCHQLGHAANEILDEEESGGPRRPAGVKGSAEGGEDNQDGNKDGHFAALLKMQGRGKVGPRTKNSDETQHSPTVVMIVVATDQLARILGSDDVASHGDRQTDGGDSCEETSPGSRSKIRQSRRRVAVRSQCPEQEADSRRRYRVRSR